MNRVYKTIAVWAVMVVAAVSVYSQEVTQDDTKDQTAQVVATDQQNNYYSGLRVSDAS